MPGTPLLLPGKQPALPDLKSLLPTARELGVTAGVVAACALLIPDHVVMSKKEIDSGVQLSTREKLIRKASVPMIVGSGLASVLTAHNKLHTLIKDPDVRKKIQTSGKLLWSTPGFYASYKMIKNSVEDEKLNLNLRDIVNSETPKKTFATMGFTGGLLYGLASQPVK